MNQQYHASDLLTNSDGSIYHLALHPEFLATNVILVGDQNRVAKVSKYFDRIEHQINKREFITHTGFIGKTRISVVSTGIGTDNIDIVLNELDAVANIDLKTRTAKTETKRLNLVRIGTTGSLQADIRVDSIVTSQFCIGLDALLGYYQYKRYELAESLLKAFVKHTNYPTALPKPYVFAGDNSLVDLLSEGNTAGITITAPGFFAPQCRQLRYNMAFPNLMDNMEGFAFNGLPLTNYEMETSGLYGLSHILGHNACTVCAVVANRVNKTYSTNAGETMERLIQHVLEKLALKNGN